MAAPAAGGHLIEDALKIGFTRDQRLIRRFLDALQGRLVPLDYGAWHALPGAGGTRLRLQRAGYGPASARYPAGSRRRAG